MINKPLIWKFLKILGFIMVPLFFIYNFYFRSNNCEEILNKIEGERYNWKVQKKFYDKENHNFLTIEIFDYSSASIKKITYPNDKGRVLENIHIEDSVYKEINSRSFLIFRNNKFYKKVSLDYGCHD